MQDNQIRKEPPNFLLIFSIAISCGMIVWALYREERINDLERESLKAKLSEKDAQLKNAPVIETELETEYESEDVKKE